MRCGGSLIGTPDCNLVVLGSNRNNWLSKQSQELIDTVSWEQGVPKAKNNQESEQMQEEKRGEQIKMNKRPK